MDKIIVMYSYDGILLNNKQWTTCTCNNMDEFQKHYTKWLSEIRQIQQITFYMVPFIWHSRKVETVETNRLITGCQWAVGKGKDRLQRGIRELSGVMKMSHMLIGVVNAQFVYLSNSLNSILKKGEYCCILNNSISIKLDFLKNSKVLSERHYKLYFVTTTKLSFQRVQSLDFPPKWKAFVHTLQRGTDALAQCLIEFVRYLEIGLLWQITC